MNKKLGVLLVSLLGMGIFSGCTLNKAAETSQLSKEKSESKVSSTISAEKETTEETTNSKTKESEISEETQESSEENRLETNYQLVINDFKSKLLGEWSYKNSLAQGIDFYQELSKIVLNEDGTFSTSLTSDLGGNHVLDEKKGTYEISENGVKQALAGFTQEIDNYDDFAKADATFGPNYIQIRFHGENGEVTVGVYIYPNGHLTFENPEELFGKNTTSLSQFEKF